MDFSGKGLTDNIQTKTTSTMQQRTLTMPQREDEDSFFDYVTEGLELVTTDPSLLPAFGGPGDLDRFGGPHHATYSSSQPTSARVHERTTPAFSYSTAVSTARGSFAPLNNVSYDNSQRYPDLTPTTTFQARPSISPSPTYFQSTSIEWQSSPASDLLYASEESSVSSNVNAFGYVSQASGQDPYMGDYASPVTSQEAAVIDSSLYWAGDSPLGGDIGPSFSNPGSTLASPILPVYGSLSRTPEGGFSDSDGEAAAAAAYGGSLTMAGDQQGQVTTSKSGSAPPRKRAKNSPERNVSISLPDILSGYQKQPLAPLLPSSTGGASDGSGSGSGSTGTGTGTTTHKSKLRSASRTSKNIVARPSESAEERKTRNSHNLVEKQYRNRLNAHFEKLLNALPDNIRSPGGSGGGDSDGGGGGGGGAASVDLGERRLSKAEVLDMSRRYIQTLEKERDKLELEREQLQGDMSRLRSAYERGSEGGGGDEREGGDGGGSLSGS